MKEFQDKIKDLKDVLDNSCKKFIESTKSFGDLTRADPGILSPIRVQTNHGIQDLKSLASFVSSSDGSRSFRINPFDSDNLVHIEKALWNAELGNVLKLKNEILLTLNPVTEEYKQKVLKTLKDGAEKTKIIIRQKRQDFLNDLKKEKSENIRDKIKKEVEDIVKKCIDEIEDIMSKFIRR